MTTAKKYTPAFMKAMKPDPFIDFLTWANTHFRLTKESSVEPGQYRSKRTPWVEEILRELSPQSPTTEVIVIKPTQAGYTTLANIMLCAVAHRYPGPAMLVQPTDDMVKKHSKKKLAPTVRAIPVLKGIIKPVKSRDAGNTLLLKEFPGGSWTLTGSNSPVSARSDSIRYLILDDYDGFIQDAGGEGAPGNLFKKRTDAFGTKKKIYINSTPTTRGVSNIEVEWLESSQGYFQVPCPHCGEYQFLKFGGRDADHGVQFTRNDDSEITDIWYQCEACHERIDEWQKTGMLEKGKYIHEFPHRKKRGFKTNSLYSPLGWVTWQQIAEEFLTAAKQMKAGDPRGMKVWTNTRMADAWEDQGDQPDWVDIKNRAEHYQALSVAKDGLILSSGVDVQHDRLAVSVWAWGKGEESWLVYHVELMGDPMHDEVWEQLDQILNGEFTRMDGVKMHILSAGVDSSDGYTTQAVRRYCRTRAPKVFALKGASTRGKPVIGMPTKQDLTWKGEKIENGVEMWPIGTDTAKSTIYGRLKITEQGPGRVHTYVGLEDEFYKQLTAEKLITRWVKGFPVQEWHNVRGNKRNEVLDCFNYAYAAAIRAGLPYLDIQTEDPNKAKPKQKKIKKPQHQNKRSRW